MTNQILMCKHSNRRKIDTNLEVFSLPVFSMRRMGFRRRHIKNPVSWLMASPGVSSSSFPASPLKLQANIATGSTGENQALYILVFSGVHMREWKKLMLWSAVLETFISGVDIVMRDITFEFLGVVCVWILTSMALKEHL